MAHIVSPKDYAGYKSDKMTFVQQDKSIHDVKFETKPVSYLRGCWRRFCRNKGSIVAGIILFLLISFAIIAPLTTPRTVSWSDANYSYVLPKNPMFNGTGFWDGTEQAKVYEAKYVEYLWYETEDKPIVGEVQTGVESSIKGDTTYYTFRHDTYAIGAKEISVSSDELAKIQEWEKDKDRKILLPLVDYEEYVDEYFDEVEASGRILVDTTTLRNNMKRMYEQEANLYYKLQLRSKGQQFEPTLDSKGQVVPLYMTDANGDYVYSANHDAEGLSKLVRVDYNVYYEYVYGAKCFYLFGANSTGFDIFVRLASGARLSLILGVSVSVINLLIGLLWGAISGYYGGTVDLVMERVTDILSSIPFVIMATLFQLHLAKQVGPIVSLLFAFVLTGWIGTASTTRMQFYRFKDQEYVLASRTLGAKDRRLIFVDILPNALGTLITSSVLMIPGVIFSESSLSFLNIIDLTNSDITSVGTLLNDGSSFLSTYPHMIMFPAIFISILMITFNLIGNGLRDAFNPTLRGEE
ncbi:MAG: ABC transporter permease [Bacilli bacterium]|nr:ABC transporter permease [Bacilli bacterium]